jgi:hypothetical protein
LNYEDLFCWVFPLLCDQVSVKNTKFSYFILSKNEPLVQIFILFCTLIFYIALLMPDTLTTLHETSFLPDILLPKYCTQTPLFNWMHFTDTLRLSDMTWYDLAHSSCSCNSSNNAVAVLVNTPTQKVATFPHTRWHNTSRFLYNKYKP